MKNAVEIVNKAEKECSKQFEKINEICEFKGSKELEAFQKNQLY